MPAVSCRKFFDVHAAQGSAIAAEALERIAALYAIRKEARGQPLNRRVTVRRAEAAPCEAKAQAVGLLFAEATQGDEPVFAIIAICAVERVADKAVLSIHPATRRL